MLIQFSHTTICITPQKGLHLAEAPQPEQAAPGHLLIKMIASAINPGDKAFINRPLHYSDKMVGAWSQYTHMHYLDCVILPANENPKDYSGSMVNIITPYSFIQQIQASGHKGILSTAGNSATGIAMVGMSIAYQFPLISVVRNQQGKQKLQALGATHVVAQDDPNFAPQLKDKTSPSSPSPTFGPKRS